MNSCWAAGFVFAVVAVGPVGPGRALCVAAQASDTNSNTNII